MPTPFTPADPPPLAPAAAGVESRFVLTPTQQGMLMGSLRHGPGYELHQVVVDMPAPVDVHRMRDAWDRAVRRHGALRTRLRWANEAEPMQEVLASVALPFAMRKADHLDAYLADDRRAGLDLASAPGFRLALVDVGDARFKLVLTHHHVMLDGRAQRLLLEEVLADYDATVSGATPPAAKQAPAFAEHVQALQARDKTAERAYFQGLLKGVDVCALPRTQAAEPSTTQTRAGGLAPARGEVRAQLTLRDAAHPMQDRAFSTASLLQAAWAYVLSLHTRRDDVVFGVTRNARHLTPLDADMVACLINTVPVRLGLRAQDTVASLAEQVQAQSLAVRPYEHASLTDIQSWIEADRLPFDTLVVYERFTLDADLRRLGGAFAQRRYAVVQQSSFPVVLAAYQDGDHVDLFLEFDATSWDAARMQTLLARLVHVFEQMQANVMSRLDALHALLPGEAERLQAWGRGPLLSQAANRTPFEHGDDPLVGAAVAAQAQAQPTAPAYIDATGRAWSYAQLMQRRDAMALLLEHHAPLAASAGPPVVATEPPVVALAAKRNLDFVALQLAAYTHGWTLVPLDPEWPVARLRAVLAAAQPRVVFVGEDAVGDRLAQAQSTAAIVKMDRAVPPAVQAAVHALDAPQPKIAVLGASGAARPAYAIFTSGSTGAPKGVLIAQRSLAAHAQGCLHAYGLHTHDRVLQFAAPAFDVAVEETVPTLVAGGSLVELPEGLMADVQAFLDHLHAMAVSVLNVPSAYFHLLVQHLHDRRVALPAGIRLVVIGSDKPTPWSVATFLASHPSVRLMNAYGPTEATISAVVCDVSALHAAGCLDGDPPIGRPLGRCEVHLLDAWGRPCPQGLPGEIAIAGPQVTMGYLNASVEAMQRLTVSPVSGQPMYRTGDLGRWREDGELEFLGRADEQVKIRGVRVELGEVEGAIRSLDNVSDAAVIVRHGGRGNELVAFVVKSGESATSEQTLRDQLKDKLPAASVPSEVRFLAELPINSSGKIHRKLLTEQALRELPVIRAVQRPIGDMETYVHGLFQRVLKRQDVDVHDSFFDIGGHSLLVSQVVGELNKVSNARVDMQTVFANPSVRSLAAVMGSTRQQVRLPSVLALNARAAAYLEADEAARASEPDPIFFVCGIALYASLAQAMEPDRAAFGIFLDLDDELMAGRRLKLHVPAVADEYLAKLREVKPHGPYLLGGVSFGGMLAYEVAQRLRRDGEAVPLLVLLDTILPRAYGGEGRVSWMLQWVRKRVAQTTGMNPKEALREWFHMRLRPRSRRVTDTATLKVLQDRVFRAAGEMHDEHLQVYEGAVVLFRARHRMEGDGEQVSWDLGWSRLLPHDYATFSVEGDHLTILAEPGNHEIARIVRRQLALLNELNRSVQPPARFK
jgi:amino acid adenylation domain-containing protein